MQGSHERNLVMLGDEAEHTRLRRHLQAFFGPENIKATYATLLHHVLDMTAALRDRAAAGGGEGGGVAVDLWTYLQDTMVDVIMKVCDTN